MPATSPLAPPKVAPRTKLGQHDFVRQDPWRKQSQKATAVTILSLVALLAAIGLLITGRRLVGALANELPRDAMLLTAVVITAIVAFARIAWRRAFPLRSDGTSELTWGDQLVGWGSSLGLLLAAVGCCFPAYRTSDWLIWLPMLVADQLWRQSFFDAGQPKLRLAAGTDDVSDETSTVRFPGVADEPQQNQIVQQLYRVRDGGGGEIIYGTLRADFQTGQRTAVLHVGFCPPLPYLPEIEAAALPGSDARLKVAQALAHGARLDVRLPVAPTEDRHVWIDMAATPATT
jgi:hypothetical protein